MDGIKKDVLFIKKIAIALIFFLGLPTAPILWAIEEGQPIRVGVYENFPLSFMDKNGKAGGFFLEILEEIASEEGWRLHYVPDSWSQCLTNLETGKIDLLGVIAFSEERGRRFDYNYESILTEWGQIYVQRFTGIESIIDLHNKKVAVLQNDMHYLVLRRQVQQFGISCRFIEAFEYEDVLKLVEIGRCDAGLVSQFYGMRHENAYRIAKSPIILSPQKLYFAVPQGSNPHLLDMLDSRLRDMKRNEGSFYYRSLDKWFGVNAKSPFGKWMLWILAGTAVLFSMFFIWSLILRAQVKSRTRELFYKNKALKGEIEQRKQAEKDRAELEVQLQRVQKMEAIGTLAGGVAHDLNNILSGVVSYPELLLLNLPEESPLRKPLLTIQKSGEKAAAIVQDLLTLARRGVAVREVVDLNRIVGEYLNSPEFARLQLHHAGIRIITDLEENLLNVLGSPVHLSKTLMNLVSNAAEASPEGGCIRISTRNRYVDAPIRGYDDIQEGDYVLMEVSDEGIGIRPVDIDRIFEPFYSRKVMGRSGTGLGMAVVWGTVKDHKGYIDVQSSPGNGTTFSLFFPITRRMLRQEIPAASPADLKGQGESILVVDDIDEQREIACEILSRLGYAVTSVSSGEAAVAYLSDRSVDLLVLDMILEGGMDGLETYKEILKRYPEQRAVITSGFSETHRVKEAQRLGAGSYVKKPYLLEALGKAVRNELKRSGAYEN